MLPSHITWATLSVIEYFMLNSEYHVTALDSSMFNKDGLRCHVPKYISYLKLHVAWNSCMGMGGMF